jgi:TPP-dependent pyruvate/acetoin dehydrogenase alpha subunit
MTNNSEAAIRPSTALSNETFLQIYTQIARIHEVDEAIRKGLSSGKFRFTYWPMTGQEAIPAALAPLVSHNDYMVTTYRGIHDLVA